MMFKMDLAKEISIPFWDKTLDGIDISKAANLYQVNSFFRELVLDLIKRGKIKDTELYVFGYNRFGQLGIAAQDASLDAFGDVYLNNSLNRNVPIKNDFFTEKSPIKQIVLGWSHSIILMENDDLYVFGRNREGQLGLNDNLHRNRPIRNDFFKGKGSIKHVALGVHHSMVLMDNGDLYVFGNNWKGQLGIGFKAANLDAVGVVGPNDIMSRNRPIRNDFFTDKGSIKEIALSGEHSMILMENGDLYVFGYNQSGQLGLNDIVNRISPIRNDFFTDKGSIKQIVLGIIYSMVLMENDDLYVFGNNGFGQLGLNDNLKRNRPIRNDFFKDKGSIKYIVLGGWHSMVLMDNGDLYVFGNNWKGQLGLNDNLDRNRPIRNDFFKEKGPIKQIVLGEFDSMILMENGDLYVFGNNEYGQLGLNDNVNRNRPIRDDFFKDKDQIKQIALGGSHSMVLMNKTI